jgi:hypothetical protein
LFIALNSSVKGYQLRHKMFTSSHNSKKRFNVNISESKGGELSHKQRKRSSQYTLTSTSVQQQQQSHILSSQSKLVVLAENEYRKVYTTGSFPDLPEYSGKFKVHYSSKLYSLTTIDRCYIWPPLSVFSLPGKDSVVEIRNQSLIAVSSNSIARFWPDILEEKCMDFQVDISSKLLNVVECNFGFLVVTCNSIVFLHVDENNKHQSVTPHYLKKSMNFLDLYNWLGTSEEILDVLTLQERHHGDAQEILSLTRSSVSFWAISSSSWRFINEKIGLIDIIKSAVKTSNSYFLAVAFAKENQLVFVADCMEKGVFLVWFHGDMRSIRLLKCLSVSPSQKIRLCIPNGGPIAYVTTLNSISIIHLDSETIFDETLPFKASSAEILSCGGDTSRTWNLANEPVSTLSMICYPYGTTWAEFYVERIPSKNIVVDNNNSDQRMLERVKSIIQQAISFGQDDIEFDISKYKKYLDKSVLDVRDDIMKDDFSYIEDSLKLMEERIEFIERLNSFSLDKVFPQTSLSLLFTVEKIIGAIALLRCKDDSDKLKILESSVAAFFEKNAISNGNLSSFFLSHIENIQGLLEVSQNIYGSAHTFQFNEFMLKFFEAVLKYRSLNGDLYGFTGVSPNLEPWTEGKVIIKLLHKQFQATSKMLDEYHKTHNISFDSSSHAFVKRREQLEDCAELILCFENSRMLGNRCVDGSYNEVRRDIIRTVAKSRPQKAFDLSIKFKDNYLLLDLLYEYNERMEKEYLDIFRLSENAPDLFTFYISKGMISELFSLDENFNDELRQFLSKRKSLLWILDLKCCNYEDAVKSLMETATSKDEETKIILYSICKLCMLASNEKETQMQYVDNILNSLKINY